jgi:cell division protein FtsA
MDSRYIVALEIGSSKVTGAVAKVEPETADIKVLAIDTMPILNSVRYGRVQNVTEVSSAVNDIIRKLENHPTVAPRHVSQVFIGLGGRSFSTISTSSSKQLPTEVEITNEVIERLKRDASFNIVTDKELVAIEPRKFFIANAEVKSPIGTFGKNISGEFTAIICSPDNKKSLERVKITTIDTPARHYIPRPVAVADMVLTPSEKQLGCAVIDFGAETTTVTIYKDGKLQFISTVPLGGRTITLDLMQAFKVTEERAEFIKQTRGMAVTDRTVINPNPDQLEIDNYVQARAGEIIANALNQITVAGFKSADLPEGIIIVGGGSRLKNFNRLLENQSKMKVHYGDVDSAVKVLDGKRNISENVDVISLLRYAARTTTETCLEGVDPEIESAGRRVNPGSDYPDITSSAYRNNIPDENDDNLLNDDDENDGERKPDKGSRRGVFSFFGKKKHKEEQEDDQYEDDDPDRYLDEVDDPIDDLEDETDDEPVAETPKVTTKNRRSIMDGITNIGKRIFGSPEDDELN